MKSVIITLVFFLAINFTLSIEISTAQWQKMTGLGANIGDVQCFTISGTNIFSGTSGNGIYLSADNGSSWTAVNNGLTNLNVTALTVSGTNIFAGTDGGLFVSVNSGSSWSAVNPGLLHVGIAALAASGPYLFASTGNDLYKSDNNGSSWENIGSVLSHHYRYKSLAVLGTNIFVGLSMLYDQNFPPPPFGLIFRSADNGSTWTEVSNGLPEYTSITVHSFAALGTNIFAGTSNGVYKSADNGNSWTAVNNGLANLEVYALSVSGTNIFAGTYAGGIYLSANNGSSWTAVNNGLTNPYVRALTVSGTSIFAGTSGAGIYLSINNGSSWAVANDGFTNCVNAYAKSGTNIFAGTNDNGVYLSADNGSSWNTVNTGLTNSNVNALAVSGTSIFAGTGDGVFLSANNGSSWTAVNNGLTNLNVKSLSVSGINIFAGTLSGGVFLSANNGSSWTAVNTGLANLNVRSFTISGTNIFAGTAGGVFLSANNGSSWTAVNGGITNLNVYALAVSGTNIFAGTLGGGVFLSANNGGSWTAVNSGITNPRIQTLTVSGTNIFAGTYGSYSGSGVYKSTNNGANWLPYNNGFNLTYPDVRSLHVFNNYIFSGLYYQSAWRRDLNDIIGQCLISGYTYKDLDNSGTMDIGEPMVPYRTIKLTNGINNYYTSSDQNGLYNIYPPTGSYTLSIANPLPYYDQTPPNYPITLTTAGQISGPNNFGFYPIPNQSDLAVTLTNSVSPRPGFCHNYLITYSNVGTVTKSGTVTLDFPSLINYQSSVPSGTVIGNTITWNYSDLGPGQSANILVDFCVPVAVPLGTDLSVTGTINPIPGDLTTNNNIETIINTVIGSYDPNDKNVDHEFYISPEEIANTESLTYTIRFQNTGTASAINIFLKDELSSNLNLATLEVTSASHPYSYILSQDGLITWYFNNIMLPDSFTDEPNSHGFIKYRIKPKSSLVIGDIINNKADIYFDFNLPIETNVVTNKVGYVRPSDISVTDFMLTAPNVCKFKLNLKNNGSVPYEYADGQYVFEFNKDILNSGTGTLSILSSDLTATNQAPINPVVLTNTTPGQLQTEPNTLPGAGNGKIINPGESILVAEFQLATDAPAFTLGSYINLAWIHSTSPGKNLSSVTAYSIYIGPIKAPIEDQGTYNINFIENPLPVAIKSFTAGINKNVVNLQWITERETNNKGFEIERKAKDSNWETVGFVQGQGTVNTPTKYAFEDKGLLSGEYRFRLKQIDYNGNYNYFNLESVIKVGIPTKFDLSQNYPNPFNPTTKIDFALPLDSKVSVILYDITGREVKRLLNNEQRSAGYYTFAFNGSSLSSGIYFYRFIAESTDKQTVITKKMMFVK